MTMSISPTATAPAAPVRRSARRATRALTLSVLGLVIEIVAVAAFIELGMLVIVFAIAGLALGLRARPGLDLADPARRRATVAAVLGGVLTLLWISFLVGSIVTGEF